MGKMTYLICDNYLCGERVPDGEQGHWLQVQSWIPIPDSMKHLSFSKMALTNPFTYCSHTCAQQDAERREVSVHDDFSIRHSAPTA